MLKKFIFGLCLALVAPHALGQYSHSQTVMIDHTKVGSTNSTNFPMLFTGTYSYLATVANGGQVQSSSGYDIVFTSDSGCSSLLNWEQESWNGTTGAVIYWVQIPTLSAGSNTVIYLCYGNSAITSFQGGATGAAWNDGYFQGVWHLANGTTLSALDSTANGNNGTLEGSTPPGAGAGEIDGAATFNGSTAYIQVPAAVTTQAFTVSAWINTSSFPSSNPEFIVCGDGFPARLLQLRLNYSTGYLLAVWYAPGAGVLTGNVNLVDGNWHFVATTVIGGSSPGICIYVDGTPNCGDVTGTLANGTGQNWNIGSGGGDAGTGWFSGSIDEVRTAATNRSADWIKAEYNNQSSPSTFYCVGCSPPATPNNSGHSAIM
ncbi:MAG: DUF2341 domain-containing protein [Terriglobia bacterium]|jgi:hypothetical protein